MMNRFATGLLRLTPEFRFFSCFVEKIGTFAIAPARESTVRRTDDLTIFVKYYIKPVTTVRVPEVYVSYLVLVAVNCCKTLSCISLAFLLNNSLNAGRYFWFIRLLAV